MANLVYNLGITGVNDVDKALAGIEKRFVQHSKTIANTAGKGTGKSGGIDEAARKAKQAEKEKQALQKQTAKEAKKAENDLSREKIRNTKKEEREKLNSLKRIESEEKRATAEAGRDIERSLRQQEAARKRFARGFSTGVSRSAGKALGGIGSRGGTALALVGGYEVSQAIRSSVENQATATDIAQMARGRGGKEFSQDDILRNAHNAGMAQGFSREQVLAGQKAFLSVRGTNNEQAQASSAMWAETARAASNGTTVEDVAKYHGALTKLGITDPNEVKQAMASTLSMSRSTGVKFSDISENSDHLIERAKALGLHGLNGLTQLNSLTAASHASNPEEGEAAVDNFFKTVTANRTELKKQGINAFDSNNNITDPLSLIAQVVSKNKGNQSLIQKDLGAKGGSALAADMTSAYNTAKANTVGSDADKDKAGAEAVTKVMNELAKSSTDYSQIQKDASEQMQNVSAKWDSVMEKLKGDMEDKVLPLLPELVDNFGKLIPKITEITGDLAKFAAWAEGSPWKAVMAVLAASFSKELAISAVGTAFKGSMLKITEDFATSAASGAKSIGVLGLAAAGAAATIYAAYDQNESLKKENGGVGAGDLILGALQGKGPMEVVDEKMNADAKAKRKADDAEAAKANGDNTQALKANTESNKKLTDALMSSDPGANSSMPPRTPNPITPR